MKPKDHEEQLRQFFNNNTLDDQMLLKKYVRKHPTNKMAWYLLGREYDGQGKRGKALYCYGQAGEIYEAFENQTIKVSLESQEALEQLDRRGKRTRWMSRARLAVLLAMVVFGIGYLPAFAPSPEPQIALPALPKDVSLAQVQQTKVYYIAGAKTKERVGAALQEMLIKERINSYAILASGKPTEDGKWISWLQPPDILLSVEGKQDAAQQQIQYHDAESCQCQPTEASKPKSIYQSWKGQREQEVVLRSALDAYSRKNGRPPENLQALNQPHPQNILSGVTPFMEQLYEQEKDQLTGKAAPQGSPSETGTPSTGLPSQGSGSSAASHEPSASGLQSPLKDPLRIIVDKTNHRLALVSGSIIVRSYPVGLGADRTPEGTFEIAEKVRNPNGKSNGDFGSRGMGLSNPLYAIHGTNKPNSIGKDESLGCVRMLKEDIEELFDMAPLGTPVTIGKGLLPSEIKRGEPAFTLPLMSNETNPGKVYKWLD
ncbi:L,D-transpeptidase catalytic domain [Paenibacillus sp. 1_12]|uniref:L,D-transpeptidase n=1 Tax=Paenibacillus sp. 1_12 TaxID=1566278 RepID=UPI0008E60F1A|nr:L,D-transpeptidase [Paenibacillus sp. 1_12]SFL27514.1 L,D-transpeptidase catalytic domain [Paenibacillus sp. 1_12]